MKKNRVLKNILAIIFIALVFFLGGETSLPISQTPSVSAQTLGPCLNRVNIPLSELHWIYVPESADQLYTEEQYFFLAGQLISNNVVDASFCPSGGLMNNGYANACGIATTLPAVIYIQNMLDEAILQAWKEVGVPPVLLKQLIRRESQFYPSLYTTSENNSYFDEYGLGHITFMGMQNALQWNSDLYAKVCSISENANCVSDSGIVSQLLSSQIATCDSCRYGIDSVSVNRSVDILAEVLLGHCYQTEQLVFNATGWYSSLVVDYATIWKLTLMNYTSGPNCVLNSVGKTFDRTQGPMDWNDISANVAGENCIYGREYANKITAKYYDFPPK